MPLKEQPTHNRTQKWIKWAWTLHFIVTISVMMMGIMENASRVKYIPIQQEKVTSSCSKAFANVLAESPDDTNAIVCCTPTSFQQEKQQKETNPQLLLCTSKTKCLWFASRLTHFPDAWLLPLFPFIVQWLLLLMDPHNRNNSTRKRIYLRLGVYTILFCVRGVILYLGFNHLEDHIIDQLLGYPNNNNYYSSTCWYQDLLKTHQDDCHGSDFDFSDHVVLLYGQILPIALVEVLHTLTILVGKQSQQGAHGCVSGFWIFLIWGLGHLYLICLWNVYKTACLFHTGLEMWVGYFNSLIIQVPLALLQCTTRIPYWKQTRQVLFGDEIVETKK